MEETLFINQEKLSGSNGSFLESEYKLLKK